MKKIRCIIKRADEKRGHVTSISDSLKNLQNIVDGWIQIVELEPGVVIICNEEGRIRNMPRNFQLYGYEFYGDIIITGAEGEELTDLPEQYNLRWLDCVRD